MRLAKPDEPCEPIEYWLVTLPPTQVEPQPRVLAAELLFESCNDGYGAAQIGSDEIEVTPNHFAVTRSGGSNWRWSEGVTLQLAPRRIAARSSFTFWAGGVTRGSSIWDWRTFSGRQTAYAPPCNADGSLPEMDSHPDEFEWVPIPSVVTSKEFVERAWRTARLGTCAARVGTGDDAGFVVYGTHAGPNDATLEVVALGAGSFLVEITDDLFVTTAKRVLFEDHLEIWTSEGDPVSANVACEPPRANQASQWGVRLSNGSVFSGHGTPDPNLVHAEVARHSDRFLLKVRLDAPHSLVTFVYSDSDDGISQKSLIATSHLRHGDPRTLGTVLTIDEQAAECVIRDGELVPELH